MTRPSQKSPHLVPGVRDASELPVAAVADSTRVAGHDRPAPGLRPTDGGSDTPPRAATPSTTPTVALQLRMEADAIARADPVPAVMQLLSDTAIGEHHRSDVFAIVRELVTNAVDHGLLGLDSSLKATQDGFMEYYRLRDVRLRSLCSGCITLRVARERGSAPGCDALRIAVTDSGPGFDHEAALARAADPDYVHQSARGRGITMLRTLCNALTYNGSGNAAEVVYLLTPPAA